MQLGVDTTNDHELDSMLGQDLDDPHRIEAAHPCL